MHNLCCISRVSTRKFICKINPPSTKFKFRSFWRNFDTKKCVGETIENAYHCVAHSAQVHLAKLIDKKYLNFLIFRFAVNDLWVIMGHNSKNNTSQIMCLLLKQILIVQENDNRWYTLALKRKTRVYLNFDHLKSNPGLRGHLSQIETSGTLWRHLSHIIWLIL